MEKFKILLIEDDADARKMLAKSIAKEGYKVVTAENGRSGLEVFEKESPHIIISDLKMPEMSGLEVLHNVKKLSPNIPFILVTAFGETDTAIGALRDGVLDYIKKPIDLNLLSIALGRAKEQVAAHLKAVPYPVLLLAEDEEVTRERLGKVLEKEGWKVFTAGDGEEALTIFKQQKIDVVLTDIKMPKKDGLTSLEEMRRVSDDFEAIILTGYGDESSAIRAMHSGAMNFLRKPIDLEQLSVVVDKAIEKLNLERSLKYRTRELVLAQELIARITAEKELVVDIRDDTQRPARDFARNLLDAVPIGLVVIDQNKGIRYANRSLTAALEYHPKKCDEKFVTGMGRLGIRELSYGSLINAITKIFESPMGTIEVISTGKYSFITLTVMTLLHKDGKDHVVLMTLRGERI